MGTGDTGGAAYLHTDAQERQPRYGRLRRHWTGGGGDCGGSHAARPSA